MALRVRDIMTEAPLVTVTADTPLVDVVHLFVEARISGAPVVDADGTVRGVVSATDLLVAIDQAEDDDVDEGESGAAPSGTLRARTALDVATPELVCVDPETDVTSLARRMRAEGIHRVLVGEPQRVLGIVTAFDLLRALETP